MLKKKLPVALALLAVPILLGAQEVEQATGVTEITEAVRTEHFFLVVVAVLAAAKLLGELAERLKQPAVLGELVAGVVLGYNFGDGHFHDHRLLAAVQERCGFEPGDVRVVTLESQPAHVQRQRYRILDAATGLLEKGWVDVADMVERQPWLDPQPFPVHPEPDATSRPAAEVR